MICSEPIVKQPLVIISPIIAFTSVVHLAEYNGIYLIKVDVAYRYLQSTCPVHCDYGDILVTSVRDEYLNPTQSRSNIIINHSHLLSPGSLVVSRDRDVCASLVRRVKTRVKCVECQPNIIKAGFSTSLMCVFYSIVDPYIKYNRERL